MDDIFLERSKGQLLDLLVMDTFVGPCIAKLWNYCGRRDCRGGFLLGASADDGCRDYGERSRFSFVFGRYVIGNASF